MKIEADGFWLVHLRDESDYEKFSKMSGESIEELKKRPQIVDKIVNNRTGKVIYAIAAPVLPKDLLGAKNVKYWLTEIKKLIDEKFDAPKIIGLGMWWATVTKKGERCKDIFAGWKIIDGYSGTVNRILEQVEENKKPRINNFVAIIGGGEVGTRVAKKLDNYIIFDKYKHEELNKKGYLAVSMINFVAFIGWFDIIICCTTSTEYILAQKDIPAGTVIIDDSWPKAIEPGPWVIDGGIYHCPWITSDWLVEGGKVFGCLAELDSFIESEGE